MDKSTESIESFNSSVQNKKCYAFGDSICKTCRGDGSISPYSWVTELGKILNMETYNYSLKGQGYRSTLYEEKAIETIKSTYIDDADLITLAFGINDASDDEIEIGNYLDESEDTIIWCAYNCVKYIKQKAPKCTIMICGSSPQEGHKSRKIG